MGRGRKITRTHCLDCQVKLTDDNRYKSVKSRCKACHIKKVTGNDTTAPPKAPTCIACEKGRHRCRGCGTVISHGTTTCQACTDQPQEDPLPPMNTVAFLTAQYKKLDIMEHLPAAIAKINSPRLFHRIPPANPSL